MINQYMTICRACGKQILMTRCEEDGRWVPCNPLIDRYTSSHGNELYINQFGMRLYGTRDRKGPDWGYTPHRRECIR